MHKFSFLALAGMAASSLLRPSRREGQLQAAEPPAGTSVSTGANDPFRSVAIF